MKNFRLIIILVIALSILLIPLIIMQFNDNVNWDLTDFIVAGVLLFGSGLALELIVRRIKKQSNRIILIVLVLFILLLVYAELAVGLFGTPLAGS